MMKITHLEAQTVEIDRSSCTEQFQESIAKLTINFINVSTGLKLNAQVESVLSKISNFSALCPNSIIEVSGLTDTLGSKSYNLRLSKKRTVEIVTRLIKQGVQLDRLKAIGFGEAHPLTKDDTEQGTCME